MGDYIITTDAGDRFLAHYGVLGMKWGKWNSETQARYANAGNNTYYKKAKKGKDEYSRSVTDTRRAYNANQPKSKQIAKNVLLGPGGAHAYNTARSRGLSRSDALSVVPAGVLYAQAVKGKQRDLKSTKPKISESAKERAEYTKDETMKKTAVKKLLGGTAGSNAYNQYKARTDSRLKGAEAATLANLGGLALSTVPGAQYALQPLTNRIIGGEKYNKQVDAPKFLTRNPGEKSHEYQVKLERKATKQAAKNAVDSKVKQSMDKPVVQQHQEARKEFWNSNKTNERIKGLNNREQSVVDEARKSKEYRSGLEGGYNLMTKGFDVDRSSSTSRAQVTQMRDNMADLARKELDRGDKKNALNSMAKAEAYDAWLNSKDDDDFKRRLGI